MLTKKRFSKKINYAAIDGLFGTPGDGDDDGIDAPLLGKSAGPARGRKLPTVARGTAIQIPMPTFSRAGTPARAGRLGSEVPPTPTSALAAGGEEEFEAEVEAEVEAEAVEAEVEMELEEELEEEEEEEEQADDWRKQFGGGGAEDDGGIGLDYEEEV